MTWKSKRITNPQECRQARMARVRDEAECVGMHLCTKGRG